MIGKRVNYKVGDVILTTAGGGRCHVLVEEKERDIKNGRPGFDGRLVDAGGKPLSDDIGDGVWGYDDQVLRVVKRGK